jgi:hypothetical protein
MTVTIRRPLATDILDVFDIKLEEGSRHPAQRSQLEERRLADSSALLQDCQAVNGLIE